jgi:hypothetical protein
MSYRRRQDNEDVTGSAGLPTAKRAVSCVDTNTRNDDPFISRQECALHLSHMETGDEIGPVQAISLMVDHGELMTVPRPRSGQQSLTIADRRRLAMCAARYREAGEPQNAEACIDRIETGDYPEVLQRDYVRGP